MRWLKTTKVQKMMIVQDLQIQNSKAHPAHQKQKNRRVKAQMKTPGMLLLRYQKVLVEVAKEQVEQPAELEAEVAVAVAVVNVMPAQPHKYFRTLLLGLAGLSLVQLQLEVARRKKQRKKRTTCPVTLKTVVDIKMQSRMRNTDFILFVKKHYFQNIL